MPRILITSTLANGSTHIGVNGFQRELAHNVKHTVSDAELEALTSSAVVSAPGVTLRIIGDREAADAAAPASVGRADGGGGDGGFPPPPVRKRVRKPARKPAK